MLRLSSLAPRTGCAGATGDEVDLAKPEHGIANPPVRVLQCREGWRTDDEATYRFCCEVDLQQCSKTPRCQVKVKLRERKIIAHSNEIYATDFVHDQEAMVARTECRRWPHLRTHCTTCAPGNLPPRRVH